MKIKEISVFKERKCNIGNYETVGLNVGIVVTPEENETQEEAYAAAELFCDEKLEYFVEKWKDPKKIVDKMTKENLTIKYDGKDMNVPF